MSKRASILNELAVKLKEIDGTAPYTSNLHTNVETRMFFPDQINDYPTVCLSSGRETREYHPSSFKWAWLTVTIRVYVEDEDTIGALEPILEDIEYVLDNNNELVYEGVHHTEEIRVVYITTDEGILAPLGIGEMQILIRYDL